MDDCETDLPVYMAGAMVAIACKMGTTRLGGSLIVADYNVLGPGMC